MRGAPRTHIAAQALHSSGKKPLLLLAGNAVDRLVQLDRAERVLLGNKTPRFRLRVILSAHAYVLLFGERTRSDGRARDPGIPLGAVQQHANCVFAHLLDPPLGVMIIHDH